MTVAYWNCCHGRSHLEMMCMRGQIFTPSICQHETIFEPNDRCYNKRFTRNKPERHDQVKSQQCPKLYFLPLFCGFASQRLDVTYACVEILYTGTRTPMLHHYSPITQ